MENKEVLLKVEHLCQYFKMQGGELKAVDDVNFDIKKGEVFGLVGESGCGKTTTGRSIIKLYDITGGNIIFKGTRISAGTRSYTDAIKKAKSDLKKAEEQLKKDVAEGKINQDAAEKRLETLKAETEAIVCEQKAELKKAVYDQKHCNKAFAEAAVERARKEYEARLATAKGAERDGLAAKYKNELRKARKIRLTNQIQMIFQDPIASLDPRMTVHDIIAEGLIIQGERDQEVIDEKVYEMLEFVGLVREHASRYPHEFSGGQRQRIGVARAIIMNPDLIIADEPVSALDVSIQAQVINLLGDLRDRGMTLLFIAHDLSVVKYFSDRIGVMYYGKMVELASSDELFLNPLHPYTKSLLSAVPLPDPVYERNRKRIVYNPLAEHDYSVDKPSFREIKPGHFVQCNDAEYEKYLKELK